MEQFGDTIRRLGGDTGQRDAAMEQPGRRKRGRPHRDVRML